MRKFSIFMILGGAVITALSILFINLAGDLVAAGYIMFAAGLLLIILGAFILVRISKTTTRSVLPEGASYSKRNALLTSPEFDFLHLLRGLIDNRRYEVLPQVALSAVITKNNAAFRNELFRTIDYCIVDSATFKPLLLIELNDSSHKREDRRLRDEKVTAICTAAKMPLVCFTLQEATDPGNVTSRIRRYLR